MLENQITAFKESMEAPQLKAKLDFSESVLTSTDLDQLVLPKRELIAGTWWRQGAQGFLFGPRGLGKTWLAVQLARCIAEGRDCGPWKIPKARQVLYVDGEMALDALRERDRALTQLPDSAMEYLSHEQHFRKTGYGLNLSSADAQHAISNLCRDKKVEVLFLDNLSCLFSGVRENDADDWEAILPWLLNLRREGVAVCFVHHSGRNGANMRGTSRREDAAFWVMKLDHPSTVDDFDGARFVSQFTKYREGAESERGPWLWSFQSENGKTTVKHTLMESLESFLQLVRDGLDSCTDIAAEMSVSPHISQREANGSKMEVRVGCESDF